MKRKTSKVPTRIWTYGCNAPMEGGDVFWEQARLAHRYYNNLIEIERNRRAAYREARSKVVPALSVLEEREAEIIEAANPLWHAEYTFKRSKQTAKLKQVREELKPFVTELKAVREAMKPLREVAKTNAQLQEEATAINERANEWQRAARKASGVFWGTYLLIEEAVKSACKPAKRKKGEKKPPRRDPKFKRWEGEGRIGVQLQGRPTVEEVLAGESSYLQIQMTGEWKPAGKKHRKRKNGRWSVGRKRGGKSPVAVVRLRVGTNGGQPVYVTLPCVIDRPLRPGTVVTWAWIKFFRIGPFTRYSLQLVLEHESFGLPWCGETWRERPAGITRTEAKKQAFLDPTYVPRPQGSGIVAVDLGWRVLKDGGLRIAYMVDDRGSSYELHLPESVVDRLKACWELQAVRDRYFEHMRDAFVSTDLSGLPKGLVKVQKQQVPKWRSQRRLAGLVRKLIDETETKPLLESLWKEWFKERQAAGLDYHDSWEVIAEWARARKAPEVLVCLEWWRRQDEHLWAWIEGQRTHAYAVRESLYATAASWLARAYGQIVIEEFDMTDFTEVRSRPYEDKTTDHGMYLRRMRNAAAPGTFRGYLVSLSGTLRTKEGLVSATGGPARVFEEEMRNSTREHFKCRFVNEWEDQEPLVLTCAYCEESFDQDENAARVLLRRHLEGSGGTSTPGPARPSDDEQLGDIDGAVAAE